MSEPNSAAKSFAEFRLTDGRRLWVGPVATYLKKGWTADPKDAPTIHLPMCMVELAQPREQKIDDGEGTFLITSEWIALDAAMAQAGPAAGAILAAARRLLPVIEARSAELGLADAPWWNGLLSNFSSEIVRAGVWLLQHGSGLDGRGLAS